MSVNTFDDLYKHYAHNIVCAQYTDLDNQVANVSLECEDCNEVLLDYEREKE